jgi:hypothetical protein
MENLCKSLHHLQDKPILFNHIVEEYISSRRQLIVRQFLDALTVGGPGGTPRPIELHAHDPTRYVGDMLAWLHQVSLFVSKRFYNRETIAALNYKKRCRSYGGFPFTELK